MRRWRQLLLTLLRALLTRTLDFFAARCALLRWQAPQFAALAQAKCTFLALLAHLQLARLLRRECGGRLLRLLGLRRSLLRTRRGLLAPLRLHAFLPLLDPPLDAFLLLLLGHRATG